jgi:iron complex outermembrane receptor protein
MEILTPRPRIGVYAIGVVLALLACPRAATAQVVPLPADLSGATLEDLMQISITSASRKEQRAGAVAAAVFVLTHDDIRRSGMRTLPELLRLVPGVQVAQINSSNWAVSIRGFNAQYSNKLLVLIDGRAIYRRSFSGVFWNAEDIVIDDIERIEVVRGPGGAVWGANAVNGVINIVTKAAAATQGLAVAVGGGTLDRAQASARYGGAFGSGAYRVYSQATAHGQTRMADGSAAGDAWQTVTSGIRVDWTRAANQWTVDGSIKGGRGRPLSQVIGGPVPGATAVTDKVQSSSGADMLARWTHRGRDGSALQVQSFLALSRHSGIVTEAETTLDADLQYHRRAGSRHDLVFGGGYRFIANTTQPTFAFTLTPPDSRNQVVNLFAEDEVTVAKGLRVTFGAKLERDTAAGWAWQPAARVMWEPGRRHHLWLSAARAIRTPSNTDLAIRIVAAVVPGPAGPIVIGIAGNPDYQPERFQDVEAGYRVDVGSIASFDVAAFRGRYQGLPTNEPVAPVFVASPAPGHVFIASRFENRLDASTRGLEFVARLAPGRTWNLSASYSSFYVSPHPAAGTRDSAAATFDGNAPTQQWQVQSSVRIGARTEVNGALFRTGRLRAMGVPAYTRADARVEVRITPRLSLIATGRNLADPRHAEYLTRSVVSTQVPRSADIQLVWRLR